MGQKSNFPDKNEHSEIFEENISMITIILMMILLTFHEIFLISPPAILCKIYGHNLACFTSTQRMSLTPSMSSEVHFLGEHCLQLPSSPCAIINTRVLLIIFSPPPPSPLSCLSSLCARAEAEAVRLSSRIHLMTICHPLICAMLTRKLRLLLSCKFGVKLAGMLRQ